MTDLLLKNILQCPRFSWGGKNLTEHGVVRKEYINALQAADNNNYEQLLKFVRS